MMSVPAEPVWVTLKVSATDKENVKQKIDAGEYEVIDALPSDIEEIHSKYITDDYNIEEDDEDWDIEIE